jgi:hypothetical protein
MWVPLWLLQPREHDPAISFGFDGDDISRADPGFLPCSGGNDHLSAPINRGVHVSKLGKQCLRSRGFSGRPGQKNHSRATCQITRLRSASHNHPYWSAQQYETAVRSAGLAKEALSTDSRSEACGQSEYSGSRTHSVLGNRSLLYADNPFWHVIRTKLSLTLIFQPLT